MLRRRHLVRYAAYAVFGCLAVAAVLAAAVLMVSVTVSGTSMEPTLHPGDRLVLDVLHRHDLHRFDVVIGHEPGKPGSEQIVKRIIGMPGDRVRVTGGAEPEVMVRPAGSTQIYVVVNPAWAGQVAMARAACCKPGGESVEANGLPGAWAEVPHGSYWVIGDNWGGSRDSRIFGFLAGTDIQARAAFRLLPLDRMGGLSGDVRLVPQM